MVLVENLQMSHNAVKEESSHALESLQIENMRLLQELEERRQKEKIQVENKQLEGSIELSGEKVALGILKGTLEDARKSLQQKDQDLVDLRQKYDEATKLPTVDEPRTEVNQLRDEVLALKRVLAEKNEEIKIWKQKFAVQERERETLIEGWKDIVATAGSPKTRKMYSPGTNSSRSSK